jgi:ATP-dependent RNA helicase DbpA
LSQKSFSSLDLHPDLIGNLDSLGFKEMTPIQAMSLPEILDDKDVIGQAKTGSGKTAAFGLGLLNKLKVKEFRVQTLILCPTRELANQVATEIRRLARSIHNIKVLTLCGGAPFGPQIGSLEHGAHIVVGTPGRIEEHLRKKTLDLQHLTTFVLDEADRMLDMGFQPVVDSIIEYIPEKRQTLLFSATFPPEIESLADRILKSPSRVEVDSGHDTSSIQQYLYKVSDNVERSTALRLLLLHFDPESALIFCTTKLQTEEVAAELRHHGFYAQSINGDLEQRDREDRLVLFSNKSSSVLVATDVAARGLDIESLDLVINFYIARDSEIHTHRIGRTGRAGSAGLACSLYQEKENYKIQVLEEYLGYPLERQELPPTSLLGSTPQKPSMITLQIDGGKKQKVRPGDILGALTGKDGIAGSDVGKISVGIQSAYIAVKKEVGKQALAILREGKVKGRSFRVRQIRG